MSSTQLTRPCMISTSFSPPIPYKPNPQLHFTPVSQTWHISVIFDSLFWRVCFSFSCLRVFACIILSPRILFSPPFYGPQVCGINKDQANENKGCLFTAWCDKGVGHHHMSFGRIEGRQRSGKVLWWKMGRLQIWSDWKLLAWETWR